MNNTSGVARRLYHMHDRRPVEFEPAEPPTWASQGNATMMVEWYVCAECDTLISAMTASFIGTPPGGLKPEPSSELEG